MRFTVDMKKCQDHGQCVYSAPSLFALDDLGKLTFREEATEMYESEDVEEDLRDDLEEAADVCPMQAIEVLD
jgi:ferredoxin